jgi:hypothetical protein
MVAASRAAAGMGYIGYPAHIFYMKIFFNRVEKHIDRLWILDEWYSDLRAYLPGYLVLSKPTEDDMQKIDKLMKCVDDRLYDAWGSYKAQFENESFDPAELEFVRKQRAILLDLDEITGISKVIDKQKMQDEEMTF